MNCTICSLRETVTSALTIQVDVTCYCIDTCRHAGGPFQMIEAKAMGCKIVSPYKRGIGDRFDINAFKRENAFKVWREFFKAKSL